jgi:hypothetical protein
MPPADLLTDLAPKDAVPAFRSAAPLAALGLGPEEGFVLSRIDGLLSIDEILDVCGMPRLEAYRYLCQLFLRGILR